MSADDIELPGEHIKITSYLSMEAWYAEAIRRFGPDPMQWRFVCPSCKHVASVADWRRLGAHPGEVAFSCIGNYLFADAFRGEGGPCNYTGGGPLQLNPVAIEGEDGKSRSAFAFAEGE